MDTFIYLNSLCEPNILISEEFSAHARTERTEMTDFIYILIIIPLCKRAKKQPTKQIFLVLAPPRKQQTNKKTKHKQTNFPALSTVTTTNLPTLSTVTTTNLSASRTVGTTKWQILTSFFTSMKEVPLICPCSNRIMLTT